MAGKNTPGRLPKLNRALSERLLLLLEQGIPLTVACPGAGINRRTLNIWRKRAGEGNKTLAEFIEKVDAAIAKGRIRLLLQVQKHGNRDFRAPAWILEHAHAAEFSAKSQVKVTLEQDRNKLLTIAENVLSPTQFDKLLAAITAEDASGIGTGETGEEDGGE
jgi:hypothetical protein